MHVQTRTVASLVSDDPRRDPTYCSYGDQVCHAGRASVAGVCALSGQSIKRGDAIYKPRPCQLAPLNAGAMILSTVLNNPMEK